MCQSGRSSFLDYDAPLYWYGQSHNRGGECVRLSFKILSIDVWTNSLYTCTIVYFRVDNFHHFPQNIFLAIHSSGLTFYLYRMSPLTLRLYQHILLINSQTQKKVVEGHVIKWCNYKMTHAIDEGNIKSGKPNVNVSFF